RANLPLRNAFRLLIHHGRVERAPARSTWPGLRPRPRFPRNLRVQSVPQPVHFEARRILIPCAPLLAAWLVLGVDNVKPGVSGRELLNGAAEPGPDLLEIDVFDVTKSVRAKNRFNASRLETTGRRFINSLELFGPLRYQLPHLF